MNIEREWKRKPPKHNVSTLRGLWADWSWRRADPESPLYRNRDDLVDFCANDCQTLSHAIAFAVESVRPNGKLHNHQSRVPQKVRDMFKDRLLTPSARARIYRAATFGHLHEVLSEFAPVGIGPVTLYDIATRIGAYQMLEPDVLFLHAGPKLGAARLLGPEAVRGRECLSMAEFPYPLNRQRADEVEDFLCVYREVIGRVRNSTARPTRVVRSGKTTRTEGEG